MANGLLQYAKSAKSKLFDGLDRPGRRWLLKGIVGICGKLVSEGVDQIVYDKRWILRFGDRYIAEPMIRLRAPEIKDSSTEHSFGVLYKPKSGDVVVNIGAGVGYETIYFSKKVSGTGKVIAVEAHPEVHACQVATYKHNKLDNVIPLNVAIADSVGTLLIEDSIEEHVGNALTDSATSSVSVKATTLDILMAEHKIRRVNFLKMNIEGAERLALKGMTAMVEETEIVCISCHDFKYRETGNEFFRTKAEVETYFKDHGFQLIDRKDKQPWLADQVNAYNPKLIQLNKA